MRIEKLLEKLPQGACILLSAPEDMRYYASFTGEGYVLLSETEKVIFTDGRYIEQSEKEAPDFKVCDIRTLKSALKEIENLIYFQENHMNCGTYSAFVNGGIELLPSGIDFAALRAVKDEKEIALLKQAAEIAEKAYAETLNFICSGKTEQEIAAYLNYQMACGGGLKTSFDTICVSGRKTSLPHGVPSEKRVEEGEFLTMDFGCVYGGYCSDMTRTVAIGYVSDEMEEVYNIVLRAQDETEKALKAGMIESAADMIARKIIIDAGYGAYFVHSTGHGVGLEIHEQPVLAPKKMNTLQIGHVVTVEPGIYLPDKFGVRIENTELITENGCSPLQKSEKELIIL